MLSLAHSKKQTNKKLNESFNRQSVRNRKTREALMEVLVAAGVAETGCEKSVGDLLYTVSTKVNEN